MPNIIDNDNRPEPSFIRLILRALQDPDNPKLCCGSLSIALAKVQGFRPTNKRESTLRNNLLEATYNFLVAKRPPDQLENWIRRFSSCNDCIKFDNLRTPRGLVNYERISHFCHTAWNEEDGVLREMLTHEYNWIASNIWERERGATYPAGLCAFLSISAELVKVSDIKMDLKPVIIGTSQTWPTNISSLIPHGPDQLVESCLQWLFIYPEPLMLEILNSAVQIGRSRLFPALVKYKAFPKIVDWMKRFLDAFLVSLEAPDFLLGTEEASSLYGTAVRSGILFSECINIITSEALPWSTKAFLMDGSQLKAVQVCSLLVSIVPILKALLASPPRQTVVEGFETMLTTSLKFEAMYLCRNFKIDNLVLAHPILENDRKAFFGSPQGFEGELGLAIIWKCSVAYGCSGKLYGCDQGLETAGKDLKRCQRCLGVLYCGKECQARAWSDEEFPHKKICRAMRKMSTAWILLGLSKERLEGMSLPDVFCEIFAREDRLTQLEHVRNVRRLFRIGDLTPEEKSALLAWGRKIYATHTSGREQWRPPIGSGYEDYGAVVERLTDPNGIYKVQPFGRLAESPSREILEEKGVFLLRPLTN